MSERMQPDDIPGGRRAFPGSAMQGGGEIFYLVKMQEETRHIERLWPLSKASLVCRMSVYGMRKALNRHGVRFVSEGTTRDGGRKYAESDLRRVFGKRFDPKEDSWGDGTACLICGAHIQDGGKTHGLCLDCWCRELNKNLIGRKLPINEAVAETVRALNLP